MHSSHRKWRLSVGLYRFLHVQMPLPELAAGWALADHTNRRNLDQVREEPLLCPELRWLSIPKGQEDRHYTGSKTSEREEESQSLSHIAYLNQLWAVLLPRVWVGANPDRSCASLVANRSRLCSSLFAAGRVQEAGSTTSPLLPTLLYPWPERLRMGWGL